jgi:hypothetical protein
LITSSKSLNKDTVTLKRASKLTLEEATQGAQISKLNKESPVEVIKSIVVLLSQLKMYVKITVDDEWLFDWAETIAQDCWDMKFDHLILALKKGASQKQYGEVLLSDVMQWINDYKLEVIRYHENKYLDNKEHGSHDRSAQKSLKELIKTQTK